MKNWASGAEVSKIGPTLGQEAVRKVYFRLLGSILGTEDCWVEGDRVQAVLGSVAAE